MKTNISLFFVVSFLCHTWANLSPLQGQHIPSRFYRVAHTDKFVAFSAGLTHFETLHVKNNDTVTYDRIFLNLGNGYNSTTGKFTSPRTGTYVFMFNALAQQNKQLQLDLYRNDDYMIGSYAHQTSDYGTVSNKIILGLDEGDTVYMKAHTDDFLYGQIDEVYTTFTGFLLVPDEGRTIHGHKGRGK